MSKTPLAPLSIVNGRLILPGEAEPIAGGIRVMGDRIAEIGSITPGADDRIHDAKGALIAPGLVDLGVFAIDLPAFHFGGISRAALMPDQNPPLDHPARVRFAAYSGKPDFWVHPLAAATRDLAGAEMAEIALMQDAGARAVATGRRWIVDTGVMHRLMQYCAMLGLPLIVHTRDAEDDTARILEEETEKGAFPALIHCFTASAEFGRKVLDLGLTISLSGIVTFKNAKDLQAVAAELPEDRLLVETDSPFLAPVPHRGRKCEPAYTADTARFVAGLRGVSPEHLAEVTTRNFFALFRKASA